MRLIDMQVSVNATAPGGHQTAQEQAVYTYRFLHDVDQARKVNIERQQSPQPAIAATMSSIVSDDVPQPARSFTNRIRRKEEHQSTDDEANGELELKSDTYGEVQKGISQPASTQTYLQLSRQKIFAVEPRFIDYSV
mgnify:CR=1 FL=1